MKKLLIAAFFCLSIVICITSIHYYRSYRLNNVCLELPNGAPEILITLKGKLCLKLCSVENDPPMYCWFLEMDTTSFKVASKTPVWGYALPLKEILDKPNWKEVQLGRHKKTEDFCCKHINQKVTVKGFLFHAHTGHHHAPFLMDLKEIYQ